MYPVDVATRSLAVSIPLASASTISSAAAQVPSGPDARARTPTEVQTTSASPPLATAPSGSTPEVVKPSRVAMRIDGSSAPAGGGSLLLD